MASTPTKPSLLHWLRERPALSSLIAIRTADELSSQMLNVAVGWQVYGATRDPMSLAYIGLAQFLPNIVMALFAGQAADCFDRRKVIGLSLFAQALCLAAFCAWPAAAAPSVGWVYLLLLILGSARTFSSPAMAAMLPQVVSGEDYPRAVAVTSSAFQICSIAGPAVGGFLYAVRSPAPFAVSTALCILAVTQTRRLAKGRDSAVVQQEGPTDESVLGGIRYVLANRLLLALTSLDLFAVLLGGATALLPIYAKDILAVGPRGLGCLRCAPGAGAAVMAFILARGTIKRDAGKLMSACVAGFGFSTVVFALSTSFWLSLAALVAAGAFDVVSMVIRETLVQISTPNAMRGRVSAVNGVFISTSSELGAFESGATAAWFGVVPAALLGGLGTLAVVALWAWIFPELSRAGTLVAEGTAGAGPG